MLFKKTYFEDFKTCKTLKFLTHQSADSKTLHLVIVNRLLLVTLISPWAMMILIDHFPVFRLSSSQPNYSFFFV